ncbi:hypothetical protein M405DRAFT_811821, partial [Rhizopogon salebrosus TDB-379]
MCLQFSDALQHPSLPILITYSCARTVRVWNIETGLEVRHLCGHMRAVLALQLDEAKLITGSMDDTIRVRNCLPPCSQGSPVNGGYPTKIYPSTRTDY